MGEAEIAGHIRAAIMSGEMVPNQRLVEADLTERYGITRSAVRAALVVLEGEGVVERLPNRGARVRQISLEEAVEIVEVREGLEVLCVRRACERLTPADAEQFSALGDQMSSAVHEGDLPRYASLNQDMDRRIWELSGHETAAVLLHRLRAQSARHQFRLAYQPGRAKESLGEHLAIIDALLARDADRAEQATRQHLSGILAALTLRSQAAAAV
ncbi:GntR family transcriptional regulator [Microbacterium amylolyticum]|uniref:DNA-binding GntR family transcriptional regulator n=1 Tax=Microbacterium amylolyticum TaxID=936337 RepID=A0ABS4ZJ77_9MICO|nr:GntR family transcriptional regulator [Microbacterium amylolyticum]MBP2437354.1 DNA-binding GntR family transcriptional regulator [Microbacterium amylolyticum]